MLPGLAALNASDLRLADSEAGGQLALSDNPPAQANGGHVLDGQLDVTSLLSTPCAATSKRTENSPPIVTTKGRQERLAAGSAHLRSLFYPARTGRSGIVGAGVLRSRHDSKVPGAIVGFLRVLVVNQLASVKRPAEYIAHHQPMFQHVPVLARIGMLRGANQNVSAAGGGSPALPSRVVLTTKAMAREKQPCHAAGAEAPEARPARIGNGVAAPALTEDVHAVNLTRVSLLTQGGHCG